MDAFRFSFNVRGLSSRAAFGERLRGAEAAGYDTVFCPDHLGANGPFPVLAAAAEITSMRIGTLVLNAPFWNPALLARDAATADLLSDGRLELGLGSGHMKWEFDEAGIGWQPFGERADRLERTVVELGNRFGRRYEQVPAEVPTPQPAQRTGFGGTGPPLIIGGTGDRVLAIAARHAQIIGVAGVFQVRGQPPGTFRLATAAEADERVAWVRERAGDRVDDVEWHLLVQVVQATADRRGAAEALAAAHGGGMSVEDVLETPYLLLGTPAQMAEQLRASRERYGYSCVTVHEAYVEAFAPVIEHLR